MYFVTTKAEARKIAREVETQGYDSIITRKRQWHSPSRKIRWGYEVVCRYDGR